MTTRVCARFGLAAILATSALGAAMADETGFASMHSQARVGGKTCMTDHYHYGSGTGRTKAAAERAAIGSWASFTDFEYGSDWARFGKAAGKRISCTKSPSGYDCQVEARPCR
jgi:hypothetical protein